MTKEKFRELLNSCKANNADLESVRCVDTYVDLQLGDLKFNALRVEKTKTTFNVSIENIFDIQVVIDNYKLEAISSFIRASIDDISKFRKFEINDIIIFVGGNKFTGDILLVKSGDHILITIGEGDDYILSSAGTASKLYNDIKIIKEYIKFSGAEL